jgi:hypothetical protein
MNSLNTTGASSKTIKLPATIWHGKTLSDLAAMGVQIVGEVDGYMVPCILPSGWSFVQSGVSPYQYRLVDDAGCVRAKIYYKSAGSICPAVMELDPVIDPNEKTELVAAASDGLIGSPRGTVLGQGHYWLTSRIWHGGTVADLEAMGIQPTGEKSGQHFKARLPEGWKVVASGVSYFQTLLVDACGAVRARLFSKPGSQGGGVEMELVATA